jgi:hypothetical protein
MAQDSNWEDEGAASVFLGHEDDTWSSESASLRNIVIEYNTWRRPVVVSADLIW